MAARNRPRDLSVRDRRRSARGVSIAVAAGRHHSGAGAGACHRPGDGPRTEAAKGSSDGGQSLRPRRQGRAAGRRYLEGQEEVTVTCVESGERAPTLTLPRKREWGPTATAGGDALNRLLR